MKDNNTKRALDPIEIVRAAKNAVGASQLQDKQNIVASMKRMEDRLWMNKAADRSWGRTAKEPTEVE